MGFLWTIFSLPLITIGASTTALYYLCTKKISGYDEGYTFSTFFKSFKENFIKSTIAFIILVAVGFIAWFNLTLSPYVNLGALAMPVRIIIFFVFVQAVFIISYIFAVIARFETTVWQALKAASFIANRHIFLTITNFILMLALLQVVFILPVLILFLMGVYGYFSSIIIVKLFRKHFPEFEESVSLPVINDDE